MADLRCFQIHAKDNVATLLDDIESGTVRVLGTASVKTLNIPQPVRLGHKIALGEIKPGDPVVKFGVRIGTATSLIHPGQWVHLHNCQSDYDERSGTLDLNSGAATDTRYE